VAGEVKPPAFDYTAVASIDEALAELGRHGDDAKLLAGGQSLMPILNMRLATPGKLVDLNRVAELDYIALRDGGVAVGAMTRQRAAERSALIAERAPLLALALPWVGHSAIRNRGTVGGSIAHADPAAELPAVALCLDARLTVRSPGGARTIDARDFFRSSLTTALAPTDLLTEVWFPGPPPGSGWAWLELSRRHGDYALAGVAAMVALDGAVVREARLALIGVDAVPFRAGETERLLAGAPLSAEALAAAAESVRRRADPPADASAAYRRHLAGVLAARALEQAAARARGA
jgi:aerobic carbon-monoxide dehydrogenase medium subunit